MPLLHHPHNATTTPRRCRLPGASRGAVHGHDEDLLPASCCSGLVRGLLPLLLVVRGLLPLLLAVLFVLLFIVSGAQPGDAVYIPKDEFLTFNLEKQSIDDIFEGLKRVLADNKPKLKFYDHSVLATKDPTATSPPGRFIYVKFIAGSDNATLAFIDSNIHVAGFQNSFSLHWNCFTTYPDLFPMGRDLGFNESYTDLVEKTEFIPHLRLGKDATIHALRILSNYDPATTPRENVKVALATFVITFSEGLRFTDVRRAITEGWDEDVYLTMEQVNWFFHWETASYCIYLSSKTGGAWPRKSCRKPRDIDIFNLTISLQKLDLLKRPKVLSINSAVY